MSSSDESFLSSSLQTPSFASSVPTSSGSSPLSHTVEDDPDRGRGKHHPYNRLCRVHKQTPQCHRTCSDSLACGKAYLYVPEDRAEECVFVDDVCTVHVPKEAYFV